METINYRKRIIDEKIERYLRLFGTVSLSGIRFSGKTWTARYHAKCESLLHDNSNELELAKMSPQVILEGEKPKLIDEWQEATNLWDEIRYDVDRTGLKGQYILTGSSTPKREGISHSGAGRFGKINMRTMSLYETGDSTGDVSLKDICEGKFIDKATGKVELRNLARLIIRGGFPGNINYSADDAKEVVNEYINLIINDDLYRLDGISRDKQKARLLLKSLARNESTIVTNSTLKNDIKEIDNEDIDVDTLSSYLAEFDRLFLIDNDEPFSTNIRSSVRVKQAEKRHFADPSMACALLNLTEDKLINDLETFGFLFESLVIHDLKVYADSFNAKCYHYQDYQNKEIDQVIELEDGSWCAFEIKLGANQIDNAAKNLINIRDTILKENGKVPIVLCVVCGLTTAAYKRPDGVYVVPITALKN